MSLLTRFKIWFIGYMGALLLRGINATLRWENRGLLANPEFWNDGGARICAFWHGRQLMMSFSKVDFERKTPLYVIISEHQDGRFIAAAINRIGIGSVAGSSSRKGSKAALQLLNKLAEGAHIAITPDGPKGPCYKVKPGVVFLASQSGRPIYPFTYGAECYWQFKSWDRMIFPKPFSRAVRIVGDPITVPSALSSEQLAEYQELLTQRLIALTAEADQHVYR